MHSFAFLCDTTTCGDYCFAPRRRTAHPERLSGVDHARSRMPTSRKPPFRNRLESSRRPFNRASLAAGSGRSVRLRPHLTAFGTTILDPTRFSKQFRKGYSRNFALTEFSEVRHFLRALAHFVP